MCHCYVCRYFWIYIVEFQPQSSWCLPTVGTTIQGVLYRRSADRGFQGFHNWRLLLGDLRTSWHSRWPCRSDGWIFSGIPEDLWVWYNWIVVYTWLWNNIFKAAVRFTLWACNWWCPSGATIKVWNIWRHYQHCISHGKHWDIKKNPDFLGNDWQTAWPSR